MANEGGIDIPNSIRGAVGEAVKQELPLSIEAHDVLNSIDSINKTAESNALSFLNSPDNWTRILVYKSPGDGPNLSDPRLQDTIVIKRVTATNALGEPRPMREISYVSSEIRPDNGIPWISTLITYLDNSNKLKARGLISYSGFETSRDSIEFARKRLSCWDGPDASVEVWRVGKTSKEKEKEQDKSHLTKLVPAQQPVPTK